MHADSQTFQETVESNFLVFVDFYADWCGPCKIIAPFIDRLADEYSGTVKFVKLNIDQSPDIARRYDVKSIPTLMIFRSGKPLRRMVGASSIVTTGASFRKSFQRIRAVNNPLVNP